jgi:DNA-binding NarL/FixJ family response regulator
MPLLRSSASTRTAFGLELARQAKKRDRAPAILVYSGDPTTERIRAALDLGVDYFAFKPVDLDEIKTALFRLVARRAAIFSSASPPRLRPAP